MAEPFVGQIQSFAFSFAPKAWALCAGQLLPIAQNSALFSLLGTQFGGNGVTTFALPDLRGRAPINQGQGPGLPLYRIGEPVGTETVTLNISNMPVHNHMMLANGLPGTALSPAGGFVAAGNDPTAGQDVNVYAPTANTSLNAQALAMSGGSQPFEISAPRLTINFSISLSGIYPSRN